MALRAGYYGVKKSVLRAIEGLSGAKIIKNIGNGLKLTNAGNLSVDIDADTMEFKAGKLAAIQGSAGGEIYSLSEVDTGKTWIDGKKIYSKTCLMFTGGSAAEGWTSPGTSRFTNTNFLPANYVDTMLYAKVFNKSGVFSTSLGHGIEIYDNSTSTFGQVIFTTPGDAYIYCEYTKQS